MKKKTLARQTAELIAEDLFTYGDARAHRLVMEFPFQPYLTGTGWCFESVVNRIEEVLLRKHLTHWIEKKTKKVDGVERLWQNGRTTTGKRRLTEE